MSNPRLGSSQMMISPRGQNSLPADLNQAQPNFGGGTDSTPAALSIDNNGNLRVTINGSAPVAGSAGVPVSIGVADTLQAAGTQVGPGPATPIVSLAVAAGTFLVDVIAGYGGVADTVVNNMDFRRGGVSIGSLYVPAAINISNKTRFWRVTMALAGNLEVFPTGGASGPTVVYIASITATRVA